MNPEMLQQLQRMFLAGGRAAGAGMDPRQKLMQAQQGLRGMQPPTAPGGELSSGGMLGSAGSPYEYSQQLQVAPREMGFAPQQVGGQFAAAPSGSPSAYSKGPALPPQPILQQGAMPGKAMPPMAQGQPMGQPMGGMRPAVKPVASAAPAGLIRGTRPMGKAAPTPQPAGLAGRARPAVKAPAPAPMSRGVAAPRRVK